MPRMITSTFFEPLIRSLDVMLATAERVIAREPATMYSRFRGAKNEREFVNLPGIAEQVAAHYEADAAARSIDLFVDVAPDALVIGDAADLHHTIVQLVASSLDHTPTNGCVATSGDVAHGVVTLIISSHHRCAPSEVHSTSQSAPDATSREGSLPWPDFCVEETEEILCAHGGRLTMDQQRGHGVRFVVRLPVG